MITIISPDNVITRASKNLRGITAHSHRQCSPGGELLLNPLIEGDSPCLRCVKTW